MVVFCLFSAVHMVVPSSSWFSVPLQRELFLVILGLLLLFWQYLVHVKRMTYIIVLEFPREREPVDFYECINYLWCIGSHGCGRWELVGVSCDLLLSTGRSPRKASCIIPSWLEGLGFLGSVADETDAIFQLKLGSRRGKGHNWWIFPFSASCFWSLEGLVDVHSH